LQIFGSLMKEPQLLSNTDKYRLVTQDFSTTFEQYIFSAIYNLYTNGAQRISVVDIDNYLASHPVGRAIFEKEKGIEYLQDAEDLAQVENFQYYYNKLKKFNCLRDLKKLGIDTRNLYEEDLLNPKAKEINERFEDLTVSGILSFVKTGLFKLESEYGVGDASSAEFVYDKMEHLVTQLQVSPEVGPGLQGDIFNTVVRGARKGKFYIRSASSGTGKTRHSVGDACFLAYPVLYNSKKCKWEYHGSTEKVLFIATEQECEEIQTLILAYLTDINEEKIIFGQYSEAEKKIISQALYVMKQFRENFIMVKMPNPNIEQLRAVVRQQFILNNIQSVFYDYIFSSPSLLNEFRDLRIREDVVLTMLSTALKDLAVEMDIFIMSSTQTNSTEEEAKGIKNQKAIRGSKGIIDKCDIAGILSTVGQEELELITESIEKKGEMPNQVLDLYKARRSRYSNVRIWSVVDLGTCRKRDLFITDARYNEVEYFKPMNVSFNETHADVIHELLSFLNDGVITSENIENLVSDIRKGAEDIIVQSTSDELLKMIEPAPTVNNTKGCLSDLL